MPEPVADARSTALHRRQPLFEAAHGRIGEARIDVALLGLREPRGRLGGIAEHVARRGEDRFRVLAFVRAQLAGADGQRSEMVIGHSRRLAVSEERRRLVWQNSPSALTAKRFPLCSPSSSATKTSPAGRCVPGWSSSITGPVPRDQAAAGHAGIPRADRAVLLGAARAGADRRRRAHLGLAGDRRIREREGRRASLAGRSGIARARSLGQRRDALRLRGTARDLADACARAPTRTCRCRPQGGATSRASRRSGTTAGRKYASRGPWLFGEFSIADAMYAPVVLRFRHYGATGLNAALAGVHAAVVAGRAAAASGSQTRRKSNGPPTPYGLLRKLYG